MSIRYHPGKANVVADALSEKSIWQGARPEGGRRNSKAIRRIGTGPVTGLRVDEKGTLWFKNENLCVPKTGVTRKIVMEEAHNSAYSIHPGSTKMYLDLKTGYGWKGMKARYSKIRGTV
ncbi:hypothetical protein U9M48_044412 [Paspalum notatum var. saurae]|uniref:Integrase zinc-binding domain-containing protein n=1 Tax=Paspalum notatum var. saurae TaxID=547442 RepID=A0AAQ3XHH4_PASNO